MTLSAWPARSQQVRDSAGIRIVSYGRNAAPKQRWTLDPKPTLQIGGVADEGPTAFARIIGAARLSDGRIAVGNAQPSEIRVFDASGKFQSSLGRNGQGPGEFNQHLYFLRRSGDTLIGIDNTMRAQVFDPDGTLARSLARPRPPVNGGAPMRLTLDPDGRAIVLVTEIPGNAPARGELQYAQVLREDGEVQYTTLLRVPVYEGTGAPLPTSFVVYGAIGRITADAARICTGFSDAFTITCYDHSGRARMSLRRVVQPRDISDEDRRFYRDMLLAGAKGAPPATIAMVEDVARRSEFAKRAPAFGRLMLAQSGEIWVSEFDRSEIAVGSTALRTTQVSLRWSVFSNDGTWLSELTLPARFTPFEMGADYVLGISLGADDVESVTLHKIRR